VRGKGETSFSFQRKEKDWNGRREKRSRRKIERYERNFQEGKLSNEPKGQKSSLKNKKRVHLQQEGRGKAPAHVLGEKEINLCFELWQKKKKRKR